MCNNRAMAPLTRQLTGRYIKKMRERKIMQGNYADKLQKSFGLLSEYELQFLTAVTKFDLPDRPTIVNIGAGRGTSGMAFIEARPDSIVYTIDIEDGSEALGGLAAERLAFERAGLGELIGTRLVQIHGDSGNGGDEYDFGQAIDLLFIDGDHSYEGCLGDLDGWQDLVKRGGYIIVHDYRREEAYRAKFPNAKNELSEENWHQVASSFPGVDKAVEERFDRKDIMRIDSLAVIKVRSS